MYKGFYSINNSLNSGKRNEVEKKGIFSFSGLDKIIIVYSIISNSPVEAQAFVLLPYNHLLSPVSA
jgi:hypothetical protein